MPYSSYKSLKKLKSSLAAYQNKRSAVSISVLLSFALFSSSSVFAAAPSFDSTPVTSVLGGELYLYELSATDPEGDPITYSFLPALPDWLSFTSPIIHGSAINVGDDSDLGTYGFTIRVTDDGGLFTDQLVTLTADFNPAWDSDDDGMPDGYELDNGFDPEVKIDAVFDADNDGLNNLAEYTAGSDPRADDQPPVISVPSEITVNSVGLYTQIDPGTATAIDGLEGVVAVSSTALLSHYRPGRHTILWTSSDSEGNSDEATQVFNVRPLVEFGNDIAVAEGGMGKVRVVLNGTAPAYPVTVSYRVSGSLASGTAMINEPDLETFITFNAFGDGIEEAVETVVLTLTDAGNAVVGANNEVSIFIHEANVAPRLSLSAIQGSRAVRTVAQADGVVKVTAAISDANADDNHTVNWAGTANALSDTDSQEGTFSFDPLQVAPGIYVLRADVCDQLNGCGDAELSITVVASLPLLSSNFDADGDGIVDQVDGQGDADNDGVPNYLDALNRSNVLQALLGDKPGQYQLESDAGSVLRLGSVAVKVEGNQTLVGMSDVATYGNNSQAVADSEYDYMDGLYDFRIEELSSDGQTVKMVIPLSSVIPESAIYRQLTVVGWGDFLSDDKNSLASAIGEEGYCPPPGDTRYNPGLTAGNWCLQLMIEDGSSNDADNKANGRVESLGGVTQRIIVASKKDEGAGAFSPWWLLFGLMLICYRRLNRPTQG